MLMFIRTLEGSTSSDWYIRTYEIKDSCQERERTNKHRRDQGLKRIMGIML